MLRIDLAIVDPRVASGMSILADLERARQNLAAEIGVFSHNGQIDGPLSTNRHAFQAIWRKLFDMACRDMLSRHGSHCPVHVRGWSRA